MLLVNKKIFFVVLIVMVFSLYNSVFAKGDDQVAVYWPGTSSFKKTVNSFTVSVDDAHQSLVAKTREHPDRFFDNTPIFIVGEEYFFAEPLKTEISLQGFYVNGMTGKIEYRKSNSSIKSKQKTMPTDAFLEIDEIN